ncbi:4-(cytidine 5'-diphospho)-2-C-methyl-D-erythritol kinase [Sneathiella sp. P13V-1]|uniref:4-(cytidine 5'-diphospho)-2-C-methyl-D-erythritol kinase n=1 Tax=Sneathiella sp. P13V-1 TaxID=2697366 RepID=UPI00187BA260|nr:4-(cytidine 5'-diphospho)-2-C-methyl-D-erythritol kinase [Sneathiella sp. P13V-1]MBE7635553.1 4-(cytidine 5'-diphospho)-2-C-methyl-D-erythritol kinase [Sneathiella sp. P13V-1]
MITELARPKVNLSLKVVGRRSDGYHLLDSLVVFPEGGDVLSFEKADDLTLEVTGEGLSEIGPAEENLVYRVAEFLKTQYTITTGAHIRLEKNLPVASGIGGGSADAAATLRGVNRLWGLNLSVSQLEGIGIKFGADIPVCIDSKTRYMRGIGEELSDPVSLPDFHMLLVNPRKSVSTPEIFKALAYPIGQEEARPKEVGAAESLDDLVMSLEALTNDLQAPAVSLIPEIADVLDFLDQSETCLFHRMSGSGATCFGQFDTKNAGQKVLEEVTKAHPDWWAELMPVTARE